MIRPASFSPPRPAAAARRQARNRVEAAVDLVRLEFERARLERDLAQLAHRSMRTRQALTRATEEAEGLIDRLAPGKRP